MCEHAIFSIIEQKYTNSENLVTLKFQKSHVSF